MCRGEVCACKCPRGQRGSQIHSAVVSHLMWELGTELRSAVGVGPVLNR